MWLWIMKKLLQIIRIEQYDRGRRLQCLKVNITLRKVKLRREQRCSDQCTISRESITDKQAVRVLHYAQKWRRGAKTECVNPYVFGIAIDRAIKSMRSHANCKCGEL